MATKKTKAAKKIVKKPTPAPKAKKVAKPAKKASKPAKKVVAKKAKPEPKAKKVKPVAKKKPAPAAKKANMPVEKKAAKPAAKPEVKMNQKKIEVKPAAAVPPKRSSRRLPSPIPRKPKREDIKPTSVGNVNFGREIKPSLVAPKIKITQQDPNKTRYSDKELSEFKNLIDEKMEAAKNELRYLQDQINRKDDNGTDDTENKFASMEDGSMSMEREYLTQMAGRQLQYVDHLEKALMRIQNKTYGICRVTGKLIDKDRLRAVPHATLSMEAKLIQNK